MMKLTCKAMGKMDCPFEATGETEEAVMGMLMGHVKEAHPEVIGSMPEDQMAAMMKSKIEQM